MSEFEERARRAADAIREEAGRISDTDAALADVLAGRSTLEPVAIDGWSRRRAYGVAALTVGTAAALIGIAVVTIGDDQAIVRNAPVPPDGPSALPAPSGPTNVTMPATGTDPPTSSDPTGVSVVEDSAPDVVPPPESTPMVPTSSSQSGAQTLPPIPTTITSDPPPTSSTMTLEPTSSTEPTTSTAPPVAWTPAQPSSPEPPSEDDLPYVIALMVSDRSDRARIEPEWSPAGGETYVQALSSADGSRSLYVQTTITAGDDTTGAPLDPIGPWKVYDASTPDGITRLLLVHGDIAVTLETNEGSPDELVQVAAGLGPRDDGGPGWELRFVPDGLAQVGADYAWRFDERTDLVIDGPDPSTEVSSTLGVEGDGRFPLAPFELRAGAEIVQFDGQRALYEPAAEALTWEFSPGTYVTFRAPGSRSVDDVMSQARELVTTTTKKFWEQSELVAEDLTCPTFDC